MKKAKYTPQELLEIIGSRSSTESLRGIFGVMIDPEELHTLTSAMMQCTVGENSK